MQDEALTRCCYGVEIRLVDNAELGLCQRLREALPPEFVSPSEPSEVSVAYLVTANVSTEPTEASTFVISCDGIPVFATTSEDEAYWWLHRDIEQTVARRSPHMLFVHAGVVAWRGVGIVIPGRTSVGKSTLVVELVRRGAIYYSDTFAVLDDQGMVHPYRAAIWPDTEAQPHDLRLLREDETEPLSIGLIVDGAYTTEIVWQPNVIRGSLAALSLVDNTVLPREQVSSMPQRAALIAEGVIALRGPRSEAVEVATTLLDTIDDALVSQALDAAGDNLRHLADELARVATIRLQSPGSRIESPSRRLEAARYVRVTNFLSPTERERLFTSALAWEEYFQESGVVSADGKAEIDHTYRKSRTLRSNRLDELWDLFEESLRAMLPTIRQQLGLPWFQLGNIERQLTAHGQGGFFRPHADTSNDPLVAGRRISCVYYFHKLPKPFSGGELKLYDTWVTPTGTIGTGTYTALEPVDNSMVFFPSSALHEVSPVHPQTDAFADSRFTITIWLWEAAQPAE